MWRALASTILCLAALGSKVVAQTYEAEAGVLTGVTVDTTATGFTGTGYVTGFDDAADQVAISINTATYGVYSLTIRYRAANGDKKAALFLDGTGAGEVSLVSSTSFTSVTAGKLLLTAGSHTLTIQSDWGCLEWIDWLKTNVGKKPAIAGLDLIDYSPTRVSHNATSHAVEDAIAWDNSGGITTFVWHWNAPSGLIDLPGQEWWRGFYTAATTFDIAAALANKNGADYKLILRDLDAIAVQLKRLQSKRIPILWRPLHESVAAGWFWWSAKGPDATIELYRLMYKRFTEYHHIHNLIWVWSSPEPAFYPGDDYVDIIGYDSYPALGDHGPVSSTYDTVISIVKDKKPVTLSEVGSIPDPDLLQVYHADWSYFVVWDGEFINDNSHNPISFLKKVYNSTYVITLGEVGNFKYLL
ncbi:glycoside hydrolase family 26 protein [Tulasnella calospora MUT 4182]|uniref:Glycoside hydrolase family 26 protein n=1 Tax=Tulasnella calospora MUT 4182 TaxID=1051891 RepID=A0A0C3Q5C2_9AGAM|nr:glycoside hydrolase family 26 protein [Tulasnella calospora MUT 4182]